MDSRTGKVYKSREEALAAGIPDKHIVMVDKPAPANERFKNKKRASERARAKAKTAKKSRKTNRRK